MGIAPVVLIILALSPGVSSQGTQGKKFLVAFPENIAFYHPTDPKNKIQITALRDSTISITPWDGQMINFYTDAETLTKNLSRGETAEFSVSKSLELERRRVSNQTVYVESSRNIIVQAISEKADSIQTALIVPVDDWGTSYYVPPLPEVTSITNDLASESLASTNPERSPFKLIVINSETANEVTLEGEANQTVTLDPYQVAQFWVNQSATAWRVSAEQPVALLFGHTCAPTGNCSCGMHLTPLTPMADKDLQFLVPPVLAKNAEDDSALLTIAKDGRTQVVPFDPQASSLVMTTASATFYRPGMLLSLIPEHKFSSCYTIHRIPNIDRNFALIVVATGETTGVHLGMEPLEQQTWNRMQGTNYSWTQIKLTQDKNVIWHDSSSIAVYFIGKKGGVFFGNPAASISTSSDFRGCVLNPEIVEVGDEEMRWQESIQYCKDKGMELISLDSAEFQRQFAKTLKSVSRDKKVNNAWIGLRRSSLTGEWYWLSYTAVGDTNWAQGEPGSPRDGQCAMMSLNSLGWRDEDCCTPAAPICYKRPNFYKHRNNNNS